MESKGTWQHLVATQNLSKWKNSLHLDLSHSPLRGSCSTSNWPSQTFTSSTELQTTKKPGTNQTHHTYPEDSNNNNDEMALGCKSATGRGSTKAASTKGKPLTKTISTTAAETAKKRLWQQQGMGQRRRPAAVPAGEAPTVSSIPMWHIFDQNIY